MVADRLSATNRYIAGVTLNAVALERSYIRNNELRAGSELRFTMRLGRASGRHARPFSMSKR